MDILIIKAICSLSAGWFLIRAFRSPTAWVEDRIIDLITGVGLVMVVIFCI